MIPKDCKRLAEVDFPIAEVSQHAAREKSIRHGHPSTLHLWWARRPLASSRAVLLALLWPDPCDPRCPPDFKARARAELPRVQGQVGPSDEDLRRALLRFIADFADWDLSANPAYLDVARALVRAAYPDEPPLVVDPFAGGGAIPLEALRVGCEAFASDLNPVACLILKVMLEDIPRHGPELAEALRQAGAAIKAQAEQALADLYPPDPDKSVPIAYLWARTVRCETPNCGAEIPLVRSFWLCKRENRKWALRPVIHRGDGGEPPRVAFEIFAPAREGEVPPGTVSRAKATCPCCGAVLAAARVRAQLAAQRGGADVIFDADGRRIGGARLLAVVTLKSNAQGRQYRLPTDRDYQAVRLAQQRLAALLDEWARSHAPAEHNHSPAPARRWDSDERTLCPVPDELLPPIGTLGFRVQRYGMQRWGDLFTARQKLALVTLVRLITEIESTQKENNIHSALQTAIAICANKVAIQNSSGCCWTPSGEFLMNTFGRQALPIVWDFAESIPFAGSTGNFEAQTEWLIEIFNQSFGCAGQVQQADATMHPLPDEAAHVWFTDPPYYDAVPYADLSDFFFVWLKRALPGHPLLRDPFDPTNPLTPKAQEAVQDATKRVDGRVKDRAWFEQTMARAFAEGRRVLRADGVGAVVFAHKTTEGWEALLAGLIRGGWTITASWPIVTERGARLRARDSAALATSVHLICRPRSAEAATGDWADVLRALPGRVADWMARLQAEGVRGADLVFACVGPALEIFSRYSRVETAEGREVTLDEYLKKVWEVVGRAALEQVLGTAEARARNGGAGALEEDARLTALFLWTLQSTNGANAPQANAEEAAPDDDDVEGEDDEDEEAAAPAAWRAKKPAGFALPFDVVRRFAQPLGIALSRWERRVIETKKGVVRLLPVAERAKQLFGKAGAAAVAAHLEQAADDDANPLQGLLFPELDALPQQPKRRRGRGAAMANVADEQLTPVPEATTLDRVHAAMLLQASGRTQALRALLKTEKERGPDFLRLANALSALYPPGSEEKRLLDAMLLAVPK
jgi:adenine-specific DNA methylase